LIEKYLDRFGWPQHEAQDEAGEQEGLVMTGWQSAGGGVGLLIDPIKERSLLRFVAVEILKAPPSSTPADRLAALLLCMGFLNRLLVLGKWSYDPSDGEVRFDLGVAIDDDHLSFEAFEHCLKIVVIAVDSHAPTLRSIAAGELTASEFLARNGSRMG
jgi:hypothetical protein